MADALRTTLDEQVAPELVLNLVYLPFIPVSRLRELVGWLHVSGAGCRKDSPLVGLPFPSEGPQARSESTAIRRGPAGLFSLTSRRACIHALTEVGDVGFGAAGLASTQASDRIAAAGWRTIASRRAAGIAVGPAAIAVGPAGIAVGCPPLLPLVPPLWPPP